MWTYTPRQLQAWVEMIDRDLAGDRADFINAVATAGMNRSKKGNKLMQDAIKKLREMS